MGQIIGLTGAMGSGKSTVAAFLAARLAARRLDADQISRGLLVPGAEGWNAVREALGSRYFNSDQTVNRPMLRQAIFSDVRLRDQLNRLLHPLVYEAMVVQVQGFFRDNPRCRVVVEVPLLFEADWQVFFDTVIVVYASDSICLARLMRRDGLSVAEARQAAGSQWPLFDKVMAADHVVDNSNSFAATYLQILHLAKVIEERTGFRNEDWGLGIQSVERGTRCNLAEKITEKSLTAKNESLTLRIDLEASGSPS